MKYTLAVTSCNRFDLLKRTLDSFLNAVDILPTATVILDDSDKPQPAFLSDNKYKALGNVRKWISNGRRRGQYYSLDRLYSALPSDSPYVFHLEDDWDIIARGTSFIRRSWEVLRDNPHVWTVSLRGTDCNGHPLVKDRGLVIHQPYWDGAWGGCHFNPGLRRLADFEQLESYGRYSGYGLAGCNGEETLSRAHLDKGFRIAALAAEPYIKHIGAVSRACEPLPPPPKVLLAVPATHNYDYADKTYGINRVTEGRVNAVRNTWFREAANFPNVTARFFYGQRDGKGPFHGDSMLNADSVELSCGDDYLSLPYKTKALCQYALEQGYDFLVKADDDSIVYVDRLLRSGFDTVDQMGWKCPCNPVNGEYKCRCYAVGMCYTLSRRAMQLVVDAPITPETWAEDLWVGQTLRAAGIQYARNGDWVPGMGEHYVKFPLPRNTVAAHSVKPEDMVKWYAARP